ncbi:tetratricopeptide repeat protein (plasmid) [Paraburkholderia strydomiana]
MSSEVVTRQLRDVVQEIHISARTSSAKSSVDLSENAINIVIPKVGISVDTVATSIRSLLPGTLQHEISGEVTQTDAGVLNLRLRVNGNVFFYETCSGPDAIAMLIKHGASKLIFETEPYIAALWIYRDGHGDTKEAEAIADRLIAAYPPDDEAIARAYNLKGLIAQQRGDLDTAEYFFRKAAPNLPIAWSNIGNNFYSKGMLEEAKRAYETNIRFTPDDPYPYYRLGDVYDDQGYLTAALAVYDKGLEYDGTSPYLHRGRGTVFSEQGKIREAKAEYEIALLQAPDYFGAHNGLGNILGALGDLGEAEREYRTAIRLYPTYDAPHTGLGNILSDRGNIDEAIAEYRLAVRLNPMSAAAYDGLSAVLLRKGEIDQAIASRLSAVKLNPKLAGP